MPVAYSVDVLRHWACKCDDGEAAAFRSHLAISGLELPVSDVAWSVVDGEVAAISNVGTWTHVVDVVAKAEKDGGDSERVNRVLNDLALAVATLDVREMHDWVELVDFVPESEAEVSAPNEHISPAPTESVNVGEVIEQAPTPAEESTQHSEASE